MKIFLLFLCFVVANADNIVLSYVDSGDKIKQFEKEINKIERSNKSLQKYTMRYKKRVKIEVFSSESADYSDNLGEISPESSEKKYEKMLDSKKPKIVIIIDDISNKSQIAQIKNLKSKITPSIFPLERKNSELINAINKLDFFMIHLPLEAKYYSDEMDTLKKGESSEIINKKISEIKAMFPQINYVNNHTGSKFTEDKDSLERLIYALDSNGISFLDSRTSPESKANIIAKENNRLILYRDIFIDNDLSQDSILNQIKNGIKIAKARGYAILIAHPHKETFRALKVANESILKDVDIVYLDELNNLLKELNIKHYAESLYGKYQNSSQIQSKK